MKAGSQSQICGWLPVILLFHNNNGQTQLTAYPHDKAIRTL
jgi:hypothetical protein